jgi:hypothetical protein
MCVGFLYGKFKKENQPLAIISLLNKKGGWFYFGLVTFKFILVKEKN